jgi:hypothetical protein
METIKPQIKNAIGNITHGYSILLEIFIGED